MKNKNILLLILSLLFSLSFWAQEKVQPKVTFIELGSVKCKPCQRMQKVIKQVEP